jgi:hypothetical protein
LKISQYPVVDRTESIDLRLRHARGSRVLDWVVVLSLCGLLFFAILAFGAVDEWSTFTLEAGSVALFLLWGAKALISREVNLSPNPLYLPALVFFGLIVLQIVLRRSAYAYVTKYEALKYVSYGIVLLIAAECIRDENARKIFALVIVAFGALYAFFALAQELTSNGKIFWIHAPRFHGSIYGSYVNHDHFAGLMEMLTPIPLVLTMGRIFRGGIRALVGFCTVLMATTIFLSGSRAGMLAFVLETALFAALTYADSWLLGFSGQGAHSGPTRRPWPWHTFEYHEGLLKNVHPSTAIGLGVGNFPNGLPRIPQLLHQPVRK